MQLKQRIGEWYARNRILTWIAGIIAINQLGFGSIVPVVPLYAASFGVSATLIGLTIAVYGLARFLASVPTGWIADTFGRRWSLATGGFVTVFGNIICAIAPSYEIFLLGRFVAGAGAAMVLTSGQIILADITEPETRGRTMALYQGVFLFAVGFGPLPGGVLAQWGGLAAPFIVYSVLGGTAAILALMRLPETYNPRTAEEEAAEPTPGFVQQIRLISRESAFLLVCIVSFAAFFARTGAIFNLVPTRGESAIGLGPSQIGLGLAMMSIISLIVTYPSGAAVDRFGRKTVIVPSIIFSGISMGVFAYAPDYTWFLISCFLWALGNGVSGAAPAAYAADVAPKGMNASAMGTYRMLADSGYVVGPALLGWLADLFGSGSALVGTGLFLVAAGLMFALLAPETRRQPNQRSDEIIVESEIDSGDDVPDAERPRA